MTFFPAANELLRDMNLPEGGSLSAKLREALLDPLSEFLDRPSKNIRAVLVDAGADCWTDDRTTQKGNVRGTLAAILELLHAGSLIVDDIQDQSETRRGKPSLHLLHGLAKSLNAGNWLYFWSLKQIQSLPLAEDRKHLLHQLFLEALLEGHIGQAFDVGMRVCDVAREEVPALCQSAMILKTGSLTCLALRAGAASAGADAQFLQWLKPLGRDLGLTLQMLDDIKNIKPARLAQADAKALEDFRNARPGFVWWIAAEHPDPKAFVQLCQLTANPNLADELNRWMNRYQIHQLARARVNACKSDLRAKLNCVLHSHPAPDAVGAVFQNVIDRLEDAYETA